MRVDGRPTELLDLPAELLFDIIVYSASSHLPLANKYLYHTFKYATPTVRAQFVLRKHTLAGRLHRPPALIDTALSYPMCTIPIIDALNRISPALSSLSPAEHKRIAASPGRWLFRNLYTHPKPKRRKLGPLSSAPPPTQNPRSNPLPFLHELASRYTLSFTERESAFALAMCVRAGPAQYSLLRFLLQAGADPSALHCLPLQVAATVGNMDALKTLIEPSEAEVKSQEERIGKGKRRRVEDRVQPTTKVLSAAVKAKHTEIAQWLMHEKGVVPDIATLQMLQDT